MASSNQGGSILSFLVIGGVLTALLVGGAYWVQQRSTRSETTQAPIAVQPADQTTKQEEKKPAPVAEDKKVAVETKKEEAKKEAPKPAPAAPSTAELPRTGPAEMISSIVGAGLLSGVSVAYMRSRRRSVVTPLT